MDSLTKKIKKLGKRMNETSSINVPLLPSIIKCFKLAFSESEIDKLLELEPRVSYRLEELNFFNDEELKNVLNKGAVWRRMKEEGEFYELAPIFPGFIEVTLSAPLDELRVEMLEEFSKFEDFLIKANIKPFRALYDHGQLMKREKKEAHMSTFVNLEPKSKKIDLNIDLDSAQSVITSKEVIDLLYRNKDELALMNCYCRLSEKHRGHECRFKMSDRTCINVGTFARAMIDYGISEKISLEEAVKIVEDCSKKGAIHTVYHYNNDAENEEIVVCNCCMDCCALYGLYNRGSISNILVKAYYSPRIYNQDKCVGCNMCGRYCPTEATYFDKETKKLVLNMDRCVGCGQCALKCKFDVRDMIKEERHVYVKTLGKKRF